MYGPVQTERFYQTDIIVVKVSRLPFSIYAEKINELHANVNVKQVSFYLTAFIHVDASFHLFALHTQRMKFIERRILIEMILKFQCQSNTAPLKFTARRLGHIVIYYRLLSHKKGEKKDKKKVCSNTGR